MKAELVFMPMPCKGHFVSMVQLAKILVNLYPNLSITVLIMKLNLDAKIAAYVDSFTATRIKFIHLSPLETHKDVAPADFITSLVLIHGPLVKEDSDTEFTIPSYLNLVSSKLFPTVMLKPKSLPMVNNLVRRLRKAKGIMINMFWELESHAVSSLSY
ncbi:hypothetical protein Goarm_023218, partial [Gossypium armourianum]|nr:hypothetical protein [Gossypium armourianum]